MQCSNCLYDLEVSPFYVEYDAAVMGSERIRIKICFI